MVGKDYETNTNQRLALAHAFKEQPMKDIKLYQAWSLLQQASVVDLEGNLTVPQVHELEDDYKSVFLTLVWQEEYNDEILDVCVEFEEGDNQTCVLEGSHLILVNTDGEEEVLTLHREWFPEV